jgi:hypothetical protein
MARYTWVLICLSFQTESHASMVQLLKIPHLQFETLEVSVNYQHNFFAGLELLSSFTLSPSPYQP